jgi:hypothetical protein
VDEIWDLEGDTNYPSTDMLEYAVASDLTNAYFYMKVAGAMMEGSQVPLMPKYRSQNNIGTLDSDLDKVPDHMDPHPFNAWDTDSDGLADDYEDVISGTNVTLADTDGDGWYDGVDFAPLDPRVPRTMPDEIPLPYRLGEDKAYIFIDSDRDIATGLIVSTQAEPLGADYVVEITGKYGHIFSKELMSYTGNGYTWEWSSLGPVPVGKDRSRLEVSVDLSMLSIDINNGLDSYFFITDWSELSYDSAFSYLTTYPYQQPSRLHNTRASNPYTSIHFHPISADIDDSGTPDYTVLDEDTPGDGVNEITGKDFSYAWIECGYNGTQIPSGSTINNLTVYMGYRNDAAWTLAPGHWGLVWSTTSEGVDNNIANYTLSTTDRDDIFTLSSGLPSVTELNSGIYLRVSGIDSDGGAWDYLDLDYLYFTVNYTVPEIVINEVNFNPGPGPYDSWNYTKNLELNASLVTDTLFDFPVLVNITDPDLKTSARADGRDIFFTLNDRETKLDHEVESYNESTGQLIAWVKIPTLSPIHNTSIFMYYGNPSSPDQSNPGGVWDENYMMVQHLEETSGTLADSTKYNNDGTGTFDSPGNINASGKIDGAVYFDGMNDFIQTDGDEMNMAQYNGTLELWVKVEDTTSTLSIFHTAENRNRGIYTEAGEFKVTMQTSIITAETVTGGTVDSSWHHLAFSWDINAGELALYIDGNLADSYSGSEWTSTARASTTRFGHSESFAVFMPAREYFNGSMDEIRVSNATRSADWISTTFNIMNSSGSFVNTGSEDFAYQYEWVELYNPGSVAVDLSGWNLTDNDGNKFSLSTAGSLAPGGYLICHLAQNGTNSSTDVYGQIINEVTLQPDGTAGKDNYLDANFANVNYGSSTNLRVENTFKEQRPIIEFNLGSIPSSGIISSDVMLYRYNGAPSLDYDVNVYRVTQAWTEAGSNWDDYDGLNDWPVNNNGGDYDTTVLDTASVLGGEDGWYSWNITDTMVGWKESSFANYGLLFIGEAGTAITDFYSSDYAVDTSLRPKLIVKYYNSSIGSIFETNDDLALLDGNDNIADYVAWGADAGTDDDPAAIMNQWTNGAYVDTSGFTINQTLARDKYSTDTDSVTDWHNATSSKGDPYGVNATIMHTQGERNIDIPEFDEYVTGLLSVVVIVIIVTGKRRKRESKDV